MYTDDDEREEYDEEKENKYQNDNEDNSPYQIVHEYNGMNYDSYLESNNEEKVKKPIDKMRLIKLTIIIILLIILSIIIYFIIHLDTHNPDVNLLIDNITINAGESGAIAYEIIDTEERVTISFVSMNPDVVSVDVNGNIYGIKKGTAVITMVYYINGTRYEKKCNVFVE